MSTRIGINDLVFPSFLREPDQPSQNVDILYASIQKFFTYSSSQGQIALRLDFSSVDPSASNEPAPPDSLSLFSLFFFFRSSSGLGSKGSVALSVSKSSSSLSSIWASGAIEGAGVGAGAFYGNEN